MDKHDHDRHIGEGWVESLAWRRTSVSSVKGLMMVMMVHVYMLLYSGSYFDHLRPSRDALHHHVLQASCQEDSFGVTHSSHTLLSPIHHIGAGRWFPCSGYPSQSAKTARELRLRKEVQTTLQVLRGWR